MQEVDTKYVLMNRKDLTFLYHGDRKEFRKKFPDEKCSVITDDFIETGSLKAAFRYGNKAAARYILEKYNKKMQHTACKDFEIVEVQAIYNIGLLS